MCYVCDRLVLGVKKKGIKIYSAMLMISGSPFRVFCWFESKQNLIIQIGYLILSIERKCTYTSWFEKNQPKVGSKETNIVFQYEIHVVSDFELQKKKKRTIFKGDAGVFIPMVSAHWHPAEKAPRPLMTQPGTWGQSPPAVCHVPDSCFSSTSELQNERKDAELQITIVAWIFLFRYLFKYP